MRQSTLMQPDLELRLSERLVLWVGIEMLCLVAQASELLGAGRGRTPWSGSDRH
jgi:hypothetical protein